MRIIRNGRNMDRKLRGKCVRCDCEVECVIRETKTLIDRNTSSGMATQYVKCPNCGDEHLWVI